MQKTGNPMDFLFFFIPDQVLSMSHLLHSNMNLFPTECDTVFQDRWYLLLLEFSYIMLFFDYKSDTSPESAQNRLRISLWKTWVSSALGIMSWQRRPLGAGVFFTAVR